MTLDDQDRGPTLHESIARQDHLLMIAETRTIESRGSKQAVAWCRYIVHNTRLTSLPQNHEKWRETIILFDGASTIDE